MVWNGIPGHTAVTIPPGQTHQILFNLHHPVAMECLTHGGDMSQEVCNKLYQASPYYNPSRLWFYSCINLLLHLNFHSISLKFISIAYPPSVHLPVTNKFICTGFNSILK
jgi:hypothetical protein